MSLRRSLFFSYGAQGITFLVTFATSVVVARLLPPHAFGVYALASAIVAMLGIATSFSVQSYVVRENELTATLLRDGFTAQLALNLLLASVLMIGASLDIAFGSRGVGSVLFVLAFVPVLGSLEFIPTSLYAREMRYDILSALAVGRAAIVALATVSCALAGLGALSLALGAIAGALYGALTIAAMRRRDMLHRPRFAGLRPIAIFGLQMMSIGGVAQAAQRLSELILGASLGLSALGLYTRASALATTIFTNVYGQATGILFAEMSRSMRETGEIGDTFERAMRIITALMWPLLAGLAILSGPLVTTLYGERWLPAALPLSLLMIAQFIVIGFGMNWELFVLRQKTAMQMRFEIVRAVFGLGAFAIGSLFSIAAAAAGRIVEAVVGYALYRPHMDALAGTPRGALRGVYREALMLTVVAVAPSLIAMIVFAWSPRAPLPVLGAATVLGAAGWLMLLRRYRHPLLDEIGVVGRKLADLSRRR